MRDDWMSLEQVARDLEISVSEATALAERENWPMVFKLHETLVLAPQAPARR